MLDDQLTIACGMGSVRLLQVQRAGKRPMPVASFGAGRSCQLEAFSAKRSSAFWTMRVPSSVPRSASATVTRSLWPKPGDSRGWK